MDNSTVFGDNASIFSTPHKDSRPATPAQPAVPRLPAGHLTGTNSPARTASPLGRSDDYFGRAPNHGYPADITPGYTPGFTPDEAYELSSMNSWSCQRSLDSRDLTDSTALLNHAAQSREPSAEPPSSRPGGYM